MVGRLPLLLALLVPACGPSTVKPQAEPAACASCHADAVAAWAASDHARAEREVGPADGWARELGAARVIGHHPVEQAVFVGEDGAWQVDDHARDVRTGGRFALLEPPASPGEWGHRDGAGMRWNGRCASCHATGLRKRLRSDGGYQTRYDALGVSCAACHGDAAAHAAGGPPPDPARRIDGTCLGCHSLRTELVDGPYVGRPLLDAFLPVTLADRRFRADGRALDEVFVGNQFMASRMHASGVRCNSCHDPHSGRTLAEGDALCAPCHPAADPAQHRAHPPGVGCVDCHMPTTTVMGVDARRDHSFSSPRRGLEPDACAGCHAANPADAPADPQQRAFAVARAGGPLDGLDLAPRNRMRHASVLTLLAGRADGAPVLRDRLAHPDPLVRAAAAWAFTAQTPADVSALRSLADDPIRAVRVGAQRALVAAGLPLAEAPDYARMLAHNADTPGARAERGEARLRDGDPLGLDDLRAAVALDPRGPAWHVALARGLASQGRDADAYRALAEARVIPADDLAFLEARGLAAAAVGRLPEARAALEAALAVDAGAARIWRNLALVCDALGERERAREAADRALSLGLADDALRRWIEDRR